jgi:hypothetical protein
MKSDRIRRLLAKGLSAVEIAKRLKVKASYVHTVKWLDKKANAKKKAQVERSHDPKVVKAEKKYLKAVKKKYLKAVKTEKPKKDPKAEAWAKNNPWFGVDEKKTAYALGLHEELVQSGVDAKSDEYYQKIDEGMKVFGKPKITRKELLKELVPGLDACFGLDKKPTKLFVQPEYKDAAMKILADNDLVNHPPHYKSGGIETIDFIEAKDLNYRLGNVVKYVSRAGKKMGSNPVQDLEKARFYLEREIAARKSA